MYTGTAVSSCPIEMSLRHLLMSLDPLRDWKPMLQNIHQSTFDGVSLYVFAGHMTHALLTNEYPRLHTQSCTLVLMSPVAIFARQFVHTPPRLNASIALGNFKMSSSRDVFTAHDSHCNTLQHTATHGNTLHHTATHCNLVMIGLGEVSARTVLLP